MCRIIPYITPMRKIFWSFFEVFETVAIAIVAVVLIRTFIAQPFLVSGASMEPSFYNGDYLLVDELAYRFREPERGEVIVFRNPIDGSAYYIKRIIGMPGERIVLENGTITVYRGDVMQTLDELYITDSIPRGQYETTLQKEEYYVLGDNRGFSFDSRNWGPLPEDRIVGLVRLRLWPVNSAKAITAPAY